jgi:hypothetical protein
MTKILITDDDGVTVGVMSPSPRISIEQFLKGVPEGHKFKVVEVSEIPSDRTFRDAWEVDSSDWETK